jgi:hypothetical protein
MDNMDKLSTIQKREKLNEIFIVDEKGNGNSNHLYEILTNDQQRNSVGVIQFQNGGRKIEGSEHGVTGEDLLEIVRHRLQCFQTSEYACRENEKALGYVEAALMWLNRRVEDRFERGVLGINAK